MESDKLPKSVAKGIVAGWYCSPIFKKIRDSVSLTSAVFQQTDEYYTRSRITRSNLADKQLHEVRDTESIVSRMAKALFKRSYRLFFSSSMLTFFRRQKRLGQQLRLQRVDLDLGRMWVSVL